MNDFKRFGYHIIERDYGKWGIHKIAKWDHPLDGPQFYFDEEFVDLAAKYSSRTGVVVDIGAHTGDSTVAMAIAAGPAGKIFAFEPNPAVFEILLVSALLNPGVGSIIPIPCAISGEEGPGIRQFHYTDENFCNGGCIEVVSAGLGVLGNVHPCTVNCIELSEILYCNRTIDFIKIDTEGAERTILSSILPEFEILKPTILMEVYQGLNQEEKEEQFDIVAQFGYEVSQWRGDDYLCIPR